jgi:ribonuclease Z
MQILFLGVGEACDPEHGNTSIQVVTSGNIHVLCDCGFSVPHRYFAFCTDPEQLDFVWISHFHGDHFFGMPLLLLRLWEMGRTRPLTVCGQRGVAAKITRALELAFPGFGAKLSYEVRFEEIEPDSPHQIAGLSFQAVQTVHSERNLGLMLDDGSKRLYYSGDGRPSQGVVELIRQCDIAIHEAFMLQDEFPSHGSITGCLELVKDCRLCKLALVHLERKFRQEQANVIEEILQANPHLVLPVQGTRLIV